MQAAACQCPCALEAPEAWLFHAISSYGEVSSCMRRFKWNGNLLVYLEDHWSKVSWPSSWDHKPLSLSLSLAPTPPPSLASFWQWGQY